MENNDRLMEGLEAVRASGRVNMLDRRGVAHQAWLSGYPELLDAMETNKDYSALLERFSEWRANRHNAQVQTQPREGKDGFTRTAIVVKSGDTSSIDLVDEHGRLIARLNAFAFDGGGFDVDVILNTEDKGQRAEAIVWNESNTAGRIPVTGVCAVNIFPPGS